jgi:hypothetical protein
MIATYDLIESCFIRSKLYSPLKKGAGVVPAMVNHEHAWTDNPLRPLF